MASEISLSVSFLASKGGASASCVQSVSLDMSALGNDMSTQTVTVNDTPEIAVPVGNVDEGGLMAIRNLSLTATVKFGLTGTAYNSMNFGVGPNETIVFRNFFPAGDLFAKASAASTLIEVVTIDP